MSCPLIKDLRLLHRAYVEGELIAPMLEDLCAMRGLQAAVSFNHVQGRGFLDSHSGALRKGKFSTGADNELYKWGQLAIVGHMREWGAHLRSDCTFLVACDQNGDVHVVSWSATEEGCPTIPAWLDRFLWPQVTVVPFRTHYGWDRNGKPEPLNWNEKRRLEEMAGAREAFLRITGGRIG